VITVVHSVVYTLYSGSSNTLKYLVITAVRSKVSSRFKNYPLSTTVSSTLMKATRAAMAVLLALTCSQCLHEVVGVGVVARFHKLQVKFSGLLAKLLSNRVELLESWNLAEGLELGQPKNAEELLHARGRCTNALFRSGIQLSRFLAALEEAVTFTGCDLARGIDLRVPDGVFSGRDRA
jgi:hypothetical protein